MYIYMQYFSVKISFSIFQLLWNNVQVVQGSGPTIKAGNIHATTVTLK